MVNSQKGKNMQKEPEKTTLDVLIIGSGPAGLSAAVYAKRASMSVKVVEKMYMGTGQVAESGRVDNYLGLPGMNGYEMGEVFRSHAEGFDVPFLEGEVCGFEQSRTAAIGLQNFQMGMYSRHERLFMLPVQSTAIWGFLAKKSLAAEVCRTVLSATGRFTAASRLWLLEVETQRWTMRSIYQNYVRKYILFTAEMNSVVPPQH